jgi:glycosyltransferase involved in cell wall biosynthesis
MNYPFATAKLEPLLKRHGARLEKAVQTAIAAARYPVKFPSLDEFGALYVYRAAVPAGLPLVERWLGRSSKPLAIDIDDPIFFATPRSPNPLTGLVGDRKWKRLCDMATVTICINQRIADYLEPYSREVTVVPNLIDMTRYPERAWGEPADRVVVGYNGSASTVPQLLEIETALERVARETPFELRVVGGPSPVSDGRFTVSQPHWTPEGEVDLLHGFDVGLAPAAPEQWSEFKSFVKILVYMAVGLPVVASAVGSANEVIEDGENGFLARSDEEWTEKLLALVRDPELRERMGHAARRTIERSYSLEGRVREIVGLFRRLTERTY